MSNWTHVAGIIRIDAIRGIEEEIDFDVLIGKEYDWESCHDTWINPKEYMPMGSEGSFLSQSVVNYCPNCGAKMK